MEFELFAGFNPYFTGSNSGSGHPIRERHLSGGVSILILLEVILEGSGSCHTVSKFPVSILILLEVILEEERATFLCYRDEVSILILLEVILEELFFVFRLLLVFLFQSLFYWK